MTRRRRRRLPRTPAPAAAGLLAALAVAVAGYGAAVVFLDGQRGRDGSISLPFAPPPAAADVPVIPGTPLPVFAVSDGVALRMVAPDVVAVAFHEASYGDATALRPMGVCHVCRNRWKFEPPPPRRPELGYIVTDTRGRSTPATSAADMVLGEGTVVMAPVTGTVTAVKHYRLYSRYPDVRVEIRPDVAADRRVVMLHLANVRLHPGDRVEASTTPIGVVRRFGFQSQVDRYVPGRHPHVHIEVKDPAEARRPPKNR